LEEVEGSVEADGTFRASTLNDGSGLHGWQFRDFNGNSVTSITLRVDEKVWSEQYAEFMGD
jgi:hypothetical protein